MPDSPLTHFDAAGQAHMVDVAGKSDTHRVALAVGTIRMRAATLALIRAGDAKKGDVIGIARIAAIQGAKRTADLVPLCHPIAITRIAVDFELDDDAGRSDAPASAGLDAPGRAAGTDRSAAVHCTARVECVGKTGVEMEALTAVQVGLLTIYDMCKAADRGMTITGVRVLEKRGGKSGDWSAT